MDKTQASTFKPVPGQNESLELFISEVENHLFFSKERNVKDNMTPEQRKALKSLSSWNKDPKCPRIFQIQDKGSRLVIEWKENYMKQMLKYLENISIFKEEEENPTLQNLKRIQEWTNKWHSEEQIGEEEKDWIETGGSKAAKIQGNIKTHKLNWPYRYIISCNGTPIENLAKWVEVYLKSLARQHPAYIKDTGHFLQYIEDLNTLKGPFNTDKILLVARDIQNFYPSCDTQKCIEAVELLLNSRPIQGPSTECIEALKITMPSNSTEFDLMFFTQIDGATSGSLDSRSMTDIFGAIHIAKVITERCPIKPENYVRFRDDTFDVCEDSNKDQQENRTDWMNDNIYPNKIKFEMKCNRKELTRK